jgi:hypothetical protein
MRDDRSDRKSDKIMGMNDIGLEPTQFLFE